MVSISFVVSFVVPAIRLGPTARFAFREPGRVALTPASSDDPLVLLDDVWLRLDGAAGPVEILRGISLAIMPGETVALVGPSGSGRYKT